jgi:putative PIN family toxin of toxin-antitoxin system
MTEHAPRVVLDTVVFLQALITGRGPAAGCIDLLRAGRFVLLMSDATFDELRIVPLRPKLTAKYPLISSERVQSLVTEIESRAVKIAKPLPVFPLPRDPKDEPFVDLAVAGNAQFIVTWNEVHLTYLMKRDTTEGREFCARYPNIRIISPPEFLAAVNSWTDAQLERER